MDYLDRKKFRTHILESYKQGQISNEAAKDLILMADHLLTARRYASYGADLKEDMKQFGLFKIIKYFHNFNPDKCKNVFNYFTRILETSFLTEYHKYNRFYEKRKKLKEICMNDFQEHYPNCKFMNNCEIVIDKDDLYEYAPGKYEY